MKRKYALDILRIIATVLIVFHHYQQVIGDFPVNGFSFYSGKYYFGNIVEFFFVLSGFLMFYYIDRIEKGLNFGEFFGKRALRLLPSVFFSSLAFYCLCMIYSQTYYEDWQGISPRFIEIIINGIGMQAGWFFDANRLNFPLWYISVLLLCYGWFYLFTWLGKKTGINKEFFYLFMMAVGLVIKTLIARGIVVHVPFFNGYAARGYSAFFFGLLLGCFYRKWKKWECYMVPGVVGLIFLILFFVNRNVQEYYLNICFFGAIVALFSTDYINKKINLPILGKIGNATFYVYVWHMPCMLLLVLLQAGLMQSLNLYTYLCMGIFTIVLFLGAVVAVYILDRIKNRKYLSGMAGLTLLFLLCIISGITA